MSPTDTGTDPADTDSDDDGVSDWAEIQHGTDPTDSSSFSTTAAQVPALGSAGLALAAIALLSAGLSRTTRRRR